jgi:hypothetical protein
MDAAAKGVVRRAAGPDQNGGSSAKAAKKGVGAGVAGLGCGYVSGRVT